MGEQLDARASHHIGIFGRKGSGKSVLAERFWTSYPRDRLVIDPTGDVDPGDPKAHKLEPPLPARWPGSLDDDRSTLYFRPDPGHPTYEDDIDRALGLAFSHGNCLVWIDEAGEAAPANGSRKGNARRVLQQGRHRNLSSLWCAPRPITLDPLVIAQADYIAIFHLPNPADRRRCADVMGWDPAEIDEAHGLLVEHGYLWYDARAHELEVRPPIPHGTKAAKAGRRFQAADEPA